MPIERPVGGLHHVAIAAPDFEQSLKLYRDVLKLPVVAQWEQTPKRFAWLDAGDGSYVEIVERPDRGDVPTGLAPPRAIAHFAFRTSDVAATLEAARALGCAIEIEANTVTVHDHVGDRPLHLTVAFFTGPSGELVELIADGL